MPVCNGQIYTVRDGDTIVAIARAHGVKLARLIAANPLINPIELVSGEKICIPLEEKSQVVDTDAGVQVPAGYRISRVVKGLAFPTSITFNDTGEMFALESGYKAGDVWSPARILKVNPDGSTAVIIRGLAPPALGLAWYKGSFYVAESGYPGQITRITMSGKREIVVRSLPTGGDYGLGDVVFGPDDMMYFGVGTATNSGVAGPDNAWLAKRPKYHDISSRNCQLKLPCNGAVFQAKPDGTGLRVYADGLRNPFGLGFAPGGLLYATDNGMDNRGSRPVNDAWDTFEEIHFGEWYGWPDYNARVPVTDPRFKPPQGAQPQFLIKKQPPLADGPAAKLTPHSVPAKFDFSTGTAFGYQGQAFVALYGHLNHDAAIVPEQEQAGFRVVRITAETGDVEDFMVILKPGAESGLLHPIQAKFGPQRAELFIVDFGNPGDLGKPPAARTGAIWKVSIG